MTTQTLDRGGSAILSHLRPADRLVAALVRRDAMWAPRVFGGVGGAGSMKGKRYESDRDKLAAEILTLHDLARYLVCSYPTALRLVSKGEIPAFRIGSDWRVRRVDVEEWIAKGGGQR